MKKVVAFALVALSLLASCSSDESISVSEEKLIRKWYFKSFKVEGETIQYDHQDCVKDYLELFPDGVYTNNYVTSCAPLNYFTDAGSWTLSGDEITFNDSGDVKIGKITQLTSTNLQITVQGDFDDDGDEETMKTNYTVN